MSAKGEAHDGNPFGIDARVLQEPGEGVVDVDHSGQPGHPKVFTTHGGDAAAREVWADAVRYLGIGVAAVITFLAPERVVIGGGVTKAGDFLFQPLRGEVRRRVKLVPVESVPILPAALGPDVGILGAAAVALDA